MGQGVGQRRHEKWSFYQYTIGIKEIKFLDVKAIDI